MVAHLGPLPAGGRELTHTPYTQPGPSRPDSITIERALLERILDRVEYLAGRIEELTRTDREFYTVGEFARLTGWKPATVREWCGQAKLKADYDERRRERWHIHPDELRRVSRKA
nr:hypothetical protein Hi04_10k_c2220_00019 [uncultured bacterium]